MLTVVTPASSRRLATAAELQSAIAGLSEADANKLLDQAGAAIESYCGRVLVSEVVDETFRDEWSDGLVMTRWPITAITSVVQDGTTLTGADYELDGTVLRRLTGDRRDYWRADKIVVRYTAGYATIPADLSRACLTLATAIQSGIGRDAAVRSLSIPDVITTSFFDPGNGGGVIPEAVRTLVDPYREMRL